LIGRPNQGKRDYKRISKKWLYQSDAGEKFKIINDSAYFFIHQLVKNFSFSKDSICFNSFDRLESLGKQIILTKVVR